ncbi:MAG TPA: MaoC/PaaZ C-terminal domain-containing protein, partial [Methylomirabilota bacterium]|nr:MaoC/PaaZ C-terminal domain-containing protein [Methylomirabilota bacterium]
WFEDFKVGDRFGSPSRTLTDAHFLFFAGMTGDAHPIHYDDEYGRKTRFGRRLAHGLLLASLTAVGASTLAPLLQESIVAFVEQTTRFLAPAFIGDTIYPEHEVVGLERKRSAGLLTLRVWLRNQRDEVVLEGQHRYLVAYRPADVGGSAAAPPDTPQRLPAR